MVTSHNDLLRDVYYRLDDMTKAYDATREKLFKKENTLEAVGTLAIAASALAIFEFFILLYKVF